ncbi:pellino E3 ubiquitin protein ligase family member 3 [Rhinolophus ferrumequinum]|uniref:Pellino E3 ubiquitin protein ligase family member 3 n=1 Tax=Rhinolophus ferrumequinum TaxID=59479 RepID=A0A7J7W8Z1_RHIFE|nr:pellino E3 ubiquitin protein ligase family member 3 [Rhinolophus ferrumequinum]
MVLEGNPEVGSPRTSDLQHPGNQGSCVLSSPGDDAQPGEEPIKYGELIVLGYNGCLASGDKGRRRSRLALSRRPHANGVKPDVMHHISTPLVSKALSNRGQHSISYTLSRSHSVIVEYTHDSDTDMFQIGRSTENMIDFVVTDTSPGGGTAEGPSAQSTISRYACRILCDRRPPYTARIYAAGFDASSNIFLGVENESNVLQDGSLIDLCGATLLWRTPAGLLRAPTLKQLEAQRQEANAARPQCPVGLSTLAFPSPARGRTAPDKQQPWVYVRCGHVHGYHGWGCRRERGPQERECPLCRLVGPYVPLWLGQEAGLCLDPGPPSHAFAPCGHVCSEKTARYWAQTPLPHGTHAFHAACPFCGAWLTGEHGCVRLIFQGPLD